MEDISLNGVELSIFLSSTELAHLDRWIASRTQSRPSRAEAIRLLLDLSQPHESKVEYLKSELARADRAVMDQFDRIFAMLDSNRMRQTLPKEETPNETPQPALRLVQSPRDGK